jgi:hypothetical protein
MQLGNAQTVLVLMKKRPAAASRMSNLHWISAHADALPLIVKSGNILTCN